MNEENNISIEEEIRIIVALIKHPAGYGVDLFGGLMCIRPTDQNTFVVEWDIRLLNDSRDEESKIDYLSFSTVEEAARYFVEKRYQYRLGVDFETEDFPEYSQKRLDGKIKDIEGIVNRRI